MTKMVIRRREILATAAALVSAGCTSRSLPSPGQLSATGVSACLAPSSDYPTPHEIARLLAPTKKGWENFELAFNRYRTGMFPAGTLEEAIQNFSAKRAADIKRFPDDPAAADRKDQADVRNAPWHITVEALKLDPFFKFTHLSLTLRASLLDTPYFGVQGVAARPSPVSTINKTNGIISSSSNYNLNEQDFSLFGNSTLFGTISNQVRTDLPRQEVHSFVIDYSTALSFVSRISQFVIEQDAIADSYKLPTHNSNTFLYSALRHGLGERFGEADLQSSIASEGLRVPGYGKLLLPDLKFDPDFLARPNELAGDVIPRVIRRSEAVSRDCVDQAKANLVAWQLKPFETILESPMPPVFPSNPGRQADSPASPPNWSALVRLGRT